MNASSLTIEYPYIAVGVFLRQVKTLPPIDENMIISSELYHRLSKSKELLVSEFNKHPQDREKHVYWINEMLRKHSKYVAKVTRELNLPMAKKSEKFKWNGYVNINIPASSLKDAQDYIKDDKTVFADFGQAVIDGYKIAVRFDDKEKNFVATLTCYDSDSDNFGYVLSSFGGDWYTSVAACLFKHYQLSGTDWTSFAPPKTGNFG